MVAKNHNQYPIPSLGDERENGLKYVQIQRTQLTIHPKGSCKSLMTCHMCAARILNVWLLKPFGLTHEILHINYNYSNISTKDNSNALMRLKRIREKLEKMNVFLENSYYGKKTYNNKSKIIQVSSNIYSSSSFRTSQLKQKEISST